MDRWTGRVERRAMSVATDRSVVLFGARIAIVPMVSAITLKKLPQVAYFDTLLLFVILLSMLSLSGCGSYGSSFSCKDARGLDCMPLSVVDQKINSGEIAEVELKARAKCKGKNCHAKSLTEKPEIKSGKTYKVKLQDETDKYEQCEIKSDDVVYLQ